jgi:hypothetical protein
VQVFGAVAPSANVNPADAPDRAHRSFDARDQNPELRGKTFWEVARLRIVLTGLEQDDDGKAVRLSRAKAPTFVRPEEVVVRSGAGLAFDPTITFPRRVVRHRRL